jgi:hypothetical protein
MDLEGLKVVREKKERIHARMKIPLPIDFTLFILNLLSLAKDFGIAESFSYSFFQ